MTPDLPPSERASKACTSVRPGGPYIGTTPGRTYGAHERPPDLARTYAGPTGSGWAICRDGGVSYLPESPAQRRCRPCWVSLRADQFDRRPEDLS
jgi:hypothetical protein